jgi:type VI secretion system secreted protein VgrG
MSTSENKQVRFVAPADDDKTAANKGLLFHHMHGREELGRPFRYDLTFLSLNGNLGPQDLLGKTITVELDLPSNPEQPTGSHRYFHGYLVRLARLGWDGYYYVYSATVRPWIWLLHNARNSRIFQNMNIPEIIEEVFQSYPQAAFEPMRGTYAPREYVVQYRETDLDFVTRLMAEEGIHYFFRHESSKHVLVLADRQSVHASLAGYEQVFCQVESNRKEVDVEHIDRWHLEQEIQSGTVVLKDFNFEKPKDGLLARASAPNPHDNADFEIYDHPGGYFEPSKGDNWAKLRLDEINARYDQRMGGGNVRGIAAGFVFTLTPWWKCPGFGNTTTGASPLGKVVSLADEEYREYLVTSTNFDIQSPNYQSRTNEGGEEFFRCTLTAIDSQRAFCMQKNLPKPVVSGPQTATVVGDKEEDITTDKYGRVKVKFHWDRRRGNERSANDIDKNGNDPNSSCWVRVAQMWAGAHFGAINIPRVGEEVIVDFLEGDPDRPIITGRVYNGDNLPPYTLPEHKTQSGIKTRSTKGGTEANFNEIRFEDKKGHEELHLQAERNMSTLVKHDQSVTVKGDRDFSVHGKETVHVDGTRTTTIEKSETENFNANRAMTVGGANNDEIVGAHTGTYNGGRTQFVSNGDTLIVAGSDKKTSVNGEYNIEASARYSVISGESDTCSFDLKEGVVTITAQHEIRLVCGDASLSLKKDGTVTIQAPTSVTATGGTTAQLELATAGAKLSGANATVDGKMLTKISGGMVEVN